MPRVNGSTLSEEKRLSEGKRHTGRICTTRERRTLGSRPSTVCEKDRPVYCILGVGAAYPHPQVEAAADCLRRLITTDTALATAIAIQRAALNVPTLLRGAARSSAAVVSPSIVPPGSC